MSPDAGTVDIDKMNALFGADRGASHCDKRRAAALNVQIGLSLVFQPLPFERFRARFELLSRRWFDQIRVRSKRVASIQIAGLVGGCEHDNNKRFEIFPAADPGKHLMSKDQWQN